MIAAGSGIRLRRMLAADAEPLFPMIFRTAVTETIQWDGPGSLEDYRQGIAHRAELAKLPGKHLFTIEEIASGSPVGMTDLRPDDSQNNLRGDLGLWIGIPYQGKGYGTQAVGLLIEYGFHQAGMEKIEASVFVGNWASRRIHEKNGFLLEGTLRKAVLKRGRWLDEWIFGITREDYEQFKAGSAGRAAAWIGHLCTRQDWQAALAEGEYRAPSLATEGFIHFSRPDQLVKTANLYYPARKDMILLQVDPARLKSELRWEASGAEVFPHLYGPLNLEAVQSVRIFGPDEDGVFRQSP